MTSPSEHDQSGPRTTGDDAPAPPRHGTWIEVDARLMRDNLRSLLHEFDATRFCFVVKADGYGHGLSTVVPLAEEVGVRDFAVFSAHEAWHALGASDGQSRIQVMGHVEPGNMDWVATWGLQPWVHDEVGWSAVRRAAERRPMSVHVEVETGMYRTGLDPDAAVGVAMAAAETDRIEVAGLCTHLAGAEDRRNEQRVGRQLEAFAGVRERLAEVGIRPPCHVSSSSAALVDHRFRMDMVRVGIAGYGLWPTPEVQRRYRPRDPARPLRLRRAMQWKTRVMALKHVPAGSFVGYGEAYCAPRDTTVAILPVGYGDGFTRSLGNAGHVLLHGRRCPIVGQVNMNMVEVDVGHVPDALPGDEVVLIGAQGGEEIGVHSFAEAQQLINYELMARLSQDIPRTIVGDGEGRTHIRGLDSEV